MPSMTSAAPMTRRWGLTPDDCTQYKGMQQIQSLWQETVSNSPSYSPRKGPGQPHGLDLHWFIELCVLCDAHHQENQKKTINSTLRGSIDTYFLLNLSLSLPLFPTTFFLFSSICLCTSFLLLNVIHNETLPYGLICTFTRPEASLSHF